MKKLSLLAAAALLSAFCIGSQSITVEAASPNSGHSPSSVGNRIMISNVPLKLSGIQGSIIGIMGNNCNIDIDSVLQEILQQLPSQKPCPPAETPDEEAPDTETPDAETPDNNVPGGNTPDTGIPDNKPENTPDNNPDNGSTDTETPDTENQSYAEEVVSLVNVERAKEGLDPLTIDIKVQEAAQIRALEIETLFSHTRPNGSSFSTVLKEQNISYKSVGENIAWGQRSPQDVVNAWMNSEGHRANIMNANYTKIGVGYYQNTQGTNYWSQLFIR